MSGGKASPAKAPAKDDPNNTPAPALKKGDKPDDAGSADPASKSFARHPRGKE